jgi:integrase
VRDSTLAGYARTLRHVSRELGALRLRDVRGDLLQQWYGRLLRTRRLAPSTVALVHRTLRVALKDAVLWDYLPGNPCDKARAPAVHRRVHAPPDAERVRALLAASQAAGDPLHALWVTAAATGARVGELTAVRWRDLTLDGPTGRGALRIERTLLTVRAGQPVFGPPKTEAGRREVALLPPAVATLRALRAARSAEALQTRGRRPTGDALVFLGARGGALDRKAVARALARAWDRAGGRRNHGWRFHDLRHYSATRMLEAHVEPQTVAAVLGHSRVSTTLDLYAHPRPERVELAVDALAAALAGAAPAAGGAG